MTLARFVCALAGLGLSATTASADTIQLDFESLVHGETITNQFDGTGVSLSAVNLRYAGALPVAFNTQLSGTADPDLQGPNWAGGNLGNTDLGRAIIIPENMNDSNGDGILNNPDDEGNRPAGSLIFAFDEEYSAFGFDVIDLESVAQEGSSLDFFLGGVLIASLDFMEFTDPNSAFYDPTVQFGNNTANRIGPITVSQIEGLASTFDAVTINVGGSGAYDNIVVIPTPASASLIALSGVLMGTRRRR